MFIRKNIVTTDNSLLPISDINTEIIPRKEPFETRE